MLKAAQIVVVLTVVLLLCVPIGRAQSIFDVDFETSQGYTAGTSASGSSDSFGTWAGFASNRIIPGNTPAANTGALSAVLGGAGNHNYDFSTATKQNMQNTAEDLFLYLSVYLPEISEQDVRLNGFGGSSSTTYGEQWQISIRSAGIAFEAEDQLGQFSNNSPGVGGDVGWYDFIMTLDLTGNISATNGVIKSVQYSLPGNASFTEFFDPTTDSHQFSSTGAGLHYNRQIFRGDNNSTANARIDSFRMVVPEPTTCTLALIGLVGLVGRMRQR